MKELLRIVKFECELERFAEVFGDNIEAVDCEGFERVAPLTPAELEGAREKPMFYSADSPEGRFEALDDATQDKLNELREKAGLEPAELGILRPFFRFVNDAYKWDDLADLERWESELFDSLNGYNQKNFKPLRLGEDIESRTRLFNKFIGYIAETVGKFEGVEVVRDCLDLVRDEIKGGL